MPQIVEVPGASMTFRMATALPLTLAVAGRGRTARGYGAQGGPWRVHG
jgi:hypothetical protein